MKPDPEREPKYFHFRVQGRPLKETVTLSESWTLSLSRVKGADTTRGLPAYCRNFASIAFS